MRVSKKILITLLFLNSLNATEKSVESCYSNATSTVAMLECQQREFTIVDKNLNDIYKLLVSKLNTKQKEALKESQRAWILFRDVEVQSRNLLLQTGGSIDSLNTGATLVDLTSKRIEELKALNEEVESLK